MTREEFYSSERGEKEYFEGIAIVDESVIVPLTREGFEALAKRATDMHNLILDDPIRSLIAGYIHHIPSNKIIFNMQDLCYVIYKGVSNNLTFAIDQEAKLKAQAEKNKEIENSNVLQMKKEDATKPSGSA